MPSFLEILVTRGEVPASTVLLATSIVLLSI